MKPVRHKIKPVPDMEGCVYCEVCNAGEGEMLSYCPGYKLSTDALEACYSGNVTDLKMYRETRDTFY